MKLEEISRGINITLLHHTITDCLALTALSGVLSFKTDELLFRRCRFDRIWTRPFCSSFQATPLNVKPILRVGASVNWLFETGCRFVLESLMWGTWYTSSYKVPILLFGPPNLNYSAFNAMILLFSLQSKEPNKNSFGFNWSIKADFRINVCSLRRFLLMFPDIWS